MTIKMKTQGMMMTVLLLFTGSLWAGGSYIGNGAGLVENNFQYAYSSLSNIFSNCKDSENCNLTESELALLEKMQVVLQYNSANSQRIEFISELKFPGFFTTGESEVHRIAKTGLTASAPIFVNSDLLYTEDGTPALDFAYIVSILTHEVGHQAGELNHRRLDILGSKIRAVVNQNIVRHQMKIEGAGRVEMLILNNDFPLKSADLFFSWEKVGSKKITPSVMSFLRCSEKNASLAGFEINNGHYLIPDDMDKVGTRVDFGMWISLYCYDPADRSVSIEKSSVKISVTRDLVSKDLLVKLKSIVRMKP